MSIRVRVAHDAARDLRELYNYIDQQDVFVD